MLKNYKILLRSKKNFYYKKIYFIFSIIFKSLNYTLKTKNKKK